MIITVCISKEACFLYSKEWLLFKATATDLLILWTGWSFRPEKTSFLYYLPAKIFSELPNTVSGNDFWLQENMNIDPSPSPSTKKTNKNKTYMEEIEKGSKRENMKKREGERENMDRQMLKKLSTE